ILSRSKLVAQDVPAFRSPLGVVLSRASLTAASFSFTSLSLALAISQVIHLLDALFAPTITSRWVAPFIIVVRLCLIFAASVLSTGTFGPRLSNSKSKFGLASHAWSSRL